MENQQHSEKPVPQVVVESEAVHLNLWQCIYRFLMFCLLTAIIVFDIYFLAKTNVNLYFDHFNLAISFLIIPFCLAFVNNNFFHWGQGAKEAQVFNCFFGFIYRLFRVIGFEHFIINLFTAFTGHSSKTLEAKLVEANYYHSIFGSQLVLMTQLHLFFMYMSDNQGYFWFATPIILHACHLALQGAEIRQANKKNAFFSFLYTFFHIDFLQNLFEGVGRAILVGLTGAIPAYNHFDGFYTTTLTREAFAIDALAAAAFCILVIVYMLFKTGFLSGLFYGFSLMFQLLCYRCDTTYMKLYNNFQRRLSPKITDGQLRFQYYWAICWRFCELIAIWAAALDNHVEIYHTLNTSSNYLSLRDVLLVGLIFDAIYLAVLFVEFILYCCQKDKFNYINDAPEGQKHQLPAGTVTEEQELNVVVAENHERKEQPKSHAAPTEPEVINTQPVINKDKAPVYIDEEALDFNLRTSKAF